MRASDDSHPRDRTLPRREPPAGSHPLALWRTERLPDIEASAIREVRRALAGGVCLHHRSWPAARRGEAAAAIAVTLDLTRRAEPDPAVVDLALSTVLVAAWRGVERGELLLRVLEAPLDLSCDRMRGAVDSPRHTGKLLQNSHGFGHVVEGGAVVIDKAV